MAIIHLACPQTGRWNESAYYMSAASAAGFAPGGGSGLGVVPPQLHLGSQRHAGWTTFERGSGPRPL